MFGATFAMPFVLSVPLCFAHDPVVISNVINTIFFASGMATLLQSTIGVRYVYQSPILTLLSVLYYYKL